MLNIGINTCKGGCDMIEIVKSNDSLNQGRLKINNEFKNIKQNVVDFIGVGSITPEKTSFIKSGKNLFNKNDLVNGRVNILGEITVDETNKTCDYQYVKPNTVYFTNKSVFTAQYDVNRTFVKYLFVTANTTFTMESSAVFIRISTAIANIDTLQVEEGNTGTQYEPYYKTLADVDFKEIHDARKSDLKDKIFLDVKQRFEEIEQDVASLEPPNVDVVDDMVAEQVFVNEMNEKAKLLGCENINFKNSSGLSATGQLTSPKDFTLITRHAAGVSDLLKVWGAKTYSVSVKGPNTRTLNINTTVQDETFEQTYKILGGKTGTLGVVHNLCVVAKHKSKGYIVGGTILRADNNRWVAMKQLFDEAVKRIENNGSESPTIESVGACAILLPENPLLYSNASLNELFLKGNTTLQSPASITKILTSLVLIENVNLNESFTYKNSDKVEDTLIFNDGDRVTFRDALYLMMLQSNNTTAKAVSRAVGQRIIRARGYAL